MTRVIPTVRNFHRSMTGYAATPLTALPALAARWRVAGAAVKDESTRMGLPAFKILGASWATNRALCLRLGALAPATTLDELRTAAAGTGLTLVTATDGNHGRALAHMARILGLSSRIYVPGELPPQVLNAIRSEGAELIDTGELYDRAVEIAAASCAADDVLIQDTAWEGYTQVPQWIVDGYSTLFAEIDEQGPVPDVVMVPTGVGSLLQAALEHYGSDATRVVAVEPTTAACVAASVAAGDPVTVDTSYPTAMAGLNCGTVSALAWPKIREHLAAAVAVTDADSAQAAAELATVGVLAGPCGAASVAGVAAALADPVTAATLQLTSTSHIVCLSTEGA